MALHSKCSFVFFSTILRTPRLLAVSLTYVWHPLRYSMRSKLFSMGFPDAPVVKNPPANAGDTDSIPDLGRSHMPVCHNYLLSLYSRAHKSKLLKPVHLRACALQ